MNDFDVILGMSWLSLQHAVLDYYAKIITNGIPRENKLKWKDIFKPIQ